MSNTIISFGHLTHRNCVLHRRVLGVYFSIVASMWDLVLSSLYLLAEVQYS
jgi:hypothetical protein